MSTLVEPTLTKKDKKLIGLTLRRCSPELLVKVAASFKENIEEYGETSISKYWLAACNRELSRRDRQLVMRRRAQKEGR